MSPDKVNKAEVVKSKSGNVSVVDEVLSLGFEFVIFSPVTPNGENCSGTFLDGYYVWKCYPSLAVVFINIRVAR
jgi:hypothetical protein